MFARAQSGLPFTPIVQGDVNGDGRGGDRAFIPDPSKESDATLVSQLTSLLNDGTASARHCLEDNLGKVAGRNGCRGPWTQSLNIQWKPTMPRRWNGRFVPNLYLQNVLAGLDQAFHGNSLHGWGSQATPDPVLLVPRGFDASANKFRYDVNPRFGDTRASRSFQRDPFRIVLDVSLNLSTDFDLQQLRRAVEPVKVDKGGWQRRSADSLTSFYLQETSSIYKLLIEQTDSLFLTRPQVAALRQADSVFSARVRAIYIPLGQFLAEGSGYAGKAQLDSAKATEKLYWKIFWEQPEIAGAIVTPAQRELIPMFDRMLQTPMEDRKTSQWSFGHAILFSDKPKQ